MSNELQSNGTPHSVAEIELPETALDAATQVYFENWFNAPWKNYKGTATGDKYKERTTMVIQAFLKGLE